MTDKTIYDHFEFYFKPMVKHVELYYPVGKNSICIKFYDLGDFIFSYNGCGKFVLKPVNYYES